MHATAALLALLVSSVVSSTQTTVVVSGNASHTIPPLLWGLMFEDIEHSGDGGLYAELIQNRAFQQVEPENQTSLFPWQPVGGANISVIADPVPLSAALPNALSLEVPSGHSSGQVGVSNMGYWGINVSSAWTYNASFYYRFPDAVPETPVTANISLVSASDGTIFASESVTLNASSDWAQAFTHITPSATAPDVFNNFTVTFDTAELCGAIHMTLFSLFPPTFKDQENGMRIDISETMGALKPSFFRFPGGNNLEGFTIASRWQWNATIGPLTDRPGRNGYWGYVNTDGLGLYEYLVWIEAMEMEPIMAVYSGYSLDYLVSNETVPEDQLGPFVEQARQQIEFVVGNTSTLGGALRASLGHPEPFELNYVEVGNEDWFGSDSYTYRWPAFVNELQALYPDISFMATSFEFNPILDPTPESYDLHVYQPPSWFTLNSDQYDGFERNGTIYLQGEYAATNLNLTPIAVTMLNASAEAAFMMGFERNADIVFASSYSSLLNHAIPPSVQQFGLIQFIDGVIIPSASYYVQQLFSMFRGDSYVPSTLADTNGEVFWSVVKQNSPASFIIKVTNADMEPHDLLFILPNTVSSSATLVQIMGGPHDANTLETPNAVVPKNSTIHAAQEFNFTAPSLSVSAIILPLV